jgi:hypothetical protein
MAKPEGLSVKLWIIRIKNINLYLPLMKCDALYLSLSLSLSFSKEDLISEVITPNIPLVWMKEFKILKLDWETRIKNILEELLVIEE